MNFETWLLHIGKSPRSATSYAGAISGVMSTWAKEAGLVSDSLLAITSPKQLSIIAKGLAAVDIFINRNSKGNGMYSAALKAYGEYLSDSSGEDIHEDIELILASPDVDKTEKSTLINARVGQGQFRKKVIDYWNGCAVTGFSDTRLLVASHIKPWRESSNRDRLDAFNGLLLLPNLDKAFDLGFISFKEQGDILISSEIEEFGQLGLKRSMNISLGDSHQEYMAYHRDIVFKG